MWPARIRYDCSRLSQSQLCTEYHKRFDPMYSDARGRIASLGCMSHFSSYMAQPKQQLDTFK